ncbi:MAG: 1,2-phenylacetyl-CoA epoxidase subunit PaaC [Betaproteobacteria bacterium]
MTTDEALFEYLLRLADTDVVFAQRLGEWIGHGPVLEEDIALANIGLDLLGQGRLWLSYAGEVEARVRGTGRDEDQLAFLREDGAYRNIQLAEMPNGDFAMTMARQFYFDHAHLLLLRALTASTDQRIADIATKAVKEVSYDTQRSAEWVIALGDGTPESQQRMQLALDTLWTYTGEMFTQDPIDRMLVDSGIAVDSSLLRAPWLLTVDAVLTEATLTRPQGEWMQGSHDRGGRQGIHTEHLGPLLAQMQHLQRAHPGAQW